MGILLARAQAGDEEALNRLFERHTRSGSTALWAQRVDAGQSKSVPILIDSAVGEASLRGVTASGTLFLARGIRGQHVYLTETEAATLTATGEPRRASRRQPGTTGAPAWSPDGRQLAFFRAEDDRRTIVIKTIADNQEQEFPIDGVTSRIWSLRWEPGGLSILFRGIIIEQTGGLKRLDLQTGKVTAVWSGAFSTYDVLAQSGVIVFSRRTGAGLEVGCLDLTTGAETLLFRPEGIAIFDDLRVSRQGDLIAYALATAKGMSLRVVDLEAPDRWNEILLAGPGDPIISLAGWTPDDHELIVRRAVTPDGTPLKESFSVGGTVWAVEVATGRMRLISRLQPGIGAGVESSPDGRHLAIELGGESLELWAFENALTRLAP